MKSYFWIKFWKNIFSLNLSFLKLSSLANRILLITKRISNELTYEEIDINSEFPPLPQPFILPSDMDVTMFRPNEIPNFCLYRFEGTMFYPPLDYEDLENLENPKEYLALKNIPVHIIVFGDNVFGVLLLTRKSMSIYHRVTQNLTAINYEDIWMIRTTLKK